MNRRNCKGFLLTYVIVAMALMGVVMIVLSSGAGTMLIRACRWARRCVSA